MPRPRASHSQPRGRPLSGADLTRCLSCAGTRITRAGKRYNTHETLQRWDCHTCNAFFTPQPAARGTVFPRKLILDALGYFYNGHTLDRTAHDVRDRFGHRLHPRTLSRWLAEYRELTTYARLRPRAMRLFTPHNLMRSTRLHHKQVYTYRVHRGKLALLLNDPQHQAFSPVADYLITGCKF